MQILQTHFFLCSLLQLPWFLQYLQNTLIRNTNLFMARKLLSDFPVWCNIYWVSLGQDEATARRRPWHSVYIARCLVSSTPRNLDVWKMRTARTDIISIHSTLLHCSIAVARPKVLGQESQVAQIQFGNCDDYHPKSVELLNHLFFFWRKFLPFFQELPFDLVFEDLRPQVRCLRWCFPRGNAEVARFFRPVWMCWDGAFFEVGPVGHRCAQWCALEAYDIIWVYYV